MEVLDELALEIRLEERHAKVEVEGVALDLHLELRQRHVAVELGVAPPEDVEVDAVEHLNAVPHRSSSTAARRASGSTR